MRRRLCPRTAARPGRGPSVRRRPHRRRCRPRAGFPVRPRPPGGWRRPPWRTWRWRAARTPPGSLPPARPVCPAPAGELRSRRARRPTRAQARRAGLDVTDMPSKTVLCSWSGPDVVRFSRGREIPLTPWGKRWSWDLCRYLRPLCALGWDVAEFAQDRTNSGFDALITDPWVASGLGPARLRGSSELAVLLEQWRFARDFLRGVVREKPGSAYRRQGWWTRMGRR